MAASARPEVLPPHKNESEKAGSGVFADEHLDMLSHLLDDFLRIPGTPIRFGLDGIVGFIPGIGDVLGGLASTMILVAAWVRGVPAVTIARMVLNLAIEMVVGSVPVVGNLFNIGWRANRRNYKLLAGSLASPAAARRHTAVSWTMFAVLGVVLVSLLLVPELLVVRLLLHMRSR